MYGYRTRGWPLLTGGCAPFLLPAHCNPQGSDILLLSVGPEFLDTHKHDRNFVMLNAVSSS